MFSLSKAVLQSREWVSLPVFALIGTIVLVALFMGIVS